MILATRHGNVERDANLGALLEAVGVPLRSAGGATATRHEIAGLPAFQQGIRIAAQAVAKLELAVWRGTADNRTRVSSTWQARFFANPPNELGHTWFFTWAGTESSLTARNNAFWLKSHDLLNPSRVNRVQVWHPDLVQTRWSRADRRAEYRLADGEGWSDWLTKGEVLHFVNGVPDPGCVLAPSPIELHRRTWATAIAKQRAEASMYDRGSKKTVAVVFPEQITPEQAQRWKEVYLETGGNGDSDVKVFGGNPSIQTIGLSFQDQQFVETQAFSLEDVGRILGVPPSLLWAASANGDRPLTPEHEEDRWHRYGREPRTMLIEQAVAADPDFFGRGARDKPGFISARPRGDARTESEALVREVQAGILLVDEARAERGLAPLPNGAGQIPQITPVGGAPNDNPSQPIGEAE